MHYNQDGWPCIGKYVGYIEDCPSTSKGFLFMTKEEKDVYELHQLFFSQLYNILNENKEQ